MQVAFVMSKYKTTLGGLLKPFQSSMVGRRWNYAKNEFSDYFMQEMKPFYKDRIRTIFKAAKSDRAVESCVSENIWKNSVKFMYDFQEP